MHATKGTSMITALTFFVLVSLGSGLTLLAIYCLIRLCEVK
jgi:hypothetical protein